jgi:DNA-binding CsgD family transcriptional regulator
MHRFLRFINKTEAVCTLWIALCFSLTSAVYLSWTYHLMLFAEPECVDIYCLVLGYAFQAAGIAISIYLFKNYPVLASRKAFIICVLIYSLVTLPALMGNSLIGILIFGFLMNLVCGGITGFYLYGTATHLKQNTRGKAFGFGYAISVVLIFLLSLMKRGRFLHTQEAYIFYLLLAAAVIAAAIRLFNSAPTHSPTKDDQSSMSVSLTLLTLAIISVVLLSLVKNMGFNFPSSDIAAGTNLELSRLFYAVGLVIAGFVSDRNRKYGAACTVTALVLPFVMLALANETLPAMICWGLDYLFYGFFSVFRAILFMDLAEQSGKYHLAVCGLLFGRIGDALGTILYRIFSFNRLWLVCIALILFALTVFLFIRLYQHLYIPNVTQEKSEREVFESFAIQHDLSAREKEVLRLVLLEQSIPQIAETLFVTESTVRYHVHNLLQKSGCKSRQELVKNYNTKLYPDISKQ